MKLTALALLLSAVVFLMAFTQTKDGGLIITKEEAQALAENMEMIETYVASMNEYIEDLQKRLKASEAKQCI